MKEPNWITTTILIAIAGALGLWGTLTLWQGGTKYEGDQPMLGHVNPMIGFVALFACILSAMLFGYAMENCDSFVE